MRFLSIEEGDLLFVIAALREAQIRDHLQQWITSSSGSLPKPRTTIRL
jgi:hypothetical protein